MPPRIAIIGGGSYNWAPTIINDILLTPPSLMAKLIEEHL